MAKKIRKEKKGVSRRMENLACHIVKVTRLI